jgi:hypothetical protein
MTVARRGLWAAAAAAVGLGATRGARAAGPPRREADDLAACRELALRASMLMDANDGPAMAALFTPDLIFIRPTTWPQATIRSRDALVAAIAARPAGLVSRHLLTNLLATRLDSDTVQVRSYFTHFSGTGPPDALGALPLAGALRSLGEYEDQMVRTAAGWRIARRVGRFAFGGA